MKTVVVGSGNPVKVEAVREAFGALFPNEVFEFVSCKAVSGVSDQPFGGEETKTGAENRARHCRKVFPDAEYVVGLEGGLEIAQEDFWVFAWMCVIDKTGKVGYGKTGSFLLPPSVGVLIREGVELGHATDIVFKEENSKQKDGTIGMLTDNAITRKDFYREAMIFALIPFTKPELY